MITCSTCSEVNPDGARFCNACGATLGAATHETRKTVTVVFADVAGSTALGEQLDPESLRRVLARYFAVAQTCIERHGGTVEKFIGDAVMGVFGVPTLHEDDALRAVRAATDLRDELGSLNDELANEFGVALRLRTGVNTGEVVTGTEERLVTGDAVNVAARLEQAAAPDEILIGDETLRLVESAVESEPVDPLELKGKGEPIRAHRLRTVVVGAPAFTRRMDAPLVGRRDELAAVASAFEAAIVDRSCRLITVLGPPGIGKSRFAQELATVVASDATIATGRCLPYGEGITFWPLVEAFREGRAERDLAAALAAGSAEDVFWAVRKALERQAREHPLVLVLDDIHWAEPTLLDLIEHLALWTRDAPLLLVCLARPELLDRRAAWGGEHLVLEPLSDAESRRLIDGLLAGTPVEAATLQRIREIAEGNPLFVEQLLALIADGGDPNHVPSTIQALLAARLDGLPRDEGTVLERASVIGLEFEWEALGELSADRGRPSGAQLAALVRKELIRPHDAIEDSFAFRHMLIRDAAYERIPKETRADLHERVASWFDGRSEEFDEIVGYHLEQAHRYLVALGHRDGRERQLGDDAADRLAAAGRRAAARGDLRATVGLIERAVALYAIDDPRRLALLAPLGRALRDGGRLDDADALLAEAIARGRDADDAIVVADARIALGDLRLHRTITTGVTRADVTREVVDVIEVFERAHHDAGLGRALAFAGELKLWAGHAQAALADLERAARHARAAGDAGQEALVLGRVLSAMRHGPTPIPEVLARTAEIETLSENRRLQLSIVLLRADLMSFEGRFDEARARLGEARAMSDDLAVPALVDMRVRPMIATVELAAGNIDEAERELRLACAGMEEIGEHGYLSSTTPQLIQVVLLQGRAAEALELSERWHPDRLTIPEDVEAQASWRRVRARALADSGAMADAEQLAREAVAMASPTDYVITRAETLTALGELLLLAGRPEEAAVALAEALQLSVAKGTLVVTARLRALLARSALPADAG